MDLVAFEAVFFLGATGEPWAEAVLLVDDAEETANGFLGTVGFFAGALAFIGF